MPRDDFGFDEDNEHDVMLALAFSRGSEETIGGDTQIVNQDVVFEQTEKRIQYTI